MVEGGCGFRIWQGHVLAQGAGDSTGFGVEVEQGGIEVAVVEHDLQIAHKRATLPGVSCVGMTQAMRCQPFEMALVGSLFYGSLDIAFMATPPHLRGAAGIAAPRRCG